MVGDRGWLCPEHAREQSRFEQQGDDVSKVERPIKRHGLGSFSLPDPPARPQNVESTEPRPYDSKVKENYCHYPNCPNRGFYTVTGERMDMPAETLRKWGWDESSGVWMCKDHLPWEVKQARLEKASNKTSARAEQAARPPRASVTQQQVKARRKGVIISAVIVVIIVLVIAGNASNKGSSEAYNAGFSVGENSNNFVTNNQAANYCSDLWTNLSGSALSKYGSNEGDWVSGCTNGVKAAN